MRIAHIIFGILLTIIVLSCIVAFIGLKTTPSEKDSEVAKVSGFVAVIAAALMFLEFCVIIVYCAFSI